MKFPTYEEMAKDVAEKALDEFIYQGKTLREWVQIISENQDSDCISREDALMALTGEWTESTDELIHRFIRRIKNLPPVTPQPKTGHWIDNHNNTISCDHCQTWFNKDDRYGYMHYCPYCNTKMIEPQKRSE